MIVQEIYKEKEKDRAINNDIQREKDEERDAGNTDGDRKINDDSQSEKDEESNAENMDEESNLLEAVQNEVGASRRDPVNYNGIHITIHNNCIGKP